MANRPHAGPGRRYILNIYGPRALRGDLWATQAAAEHRQIRRPMRPNTARCIQIPSETKLNDRISTPRRWCEKNGRDATESMRWVLRGDLWGTQAAPQAAPERRQTACEGRQRGPSACILSSEAAFEPIFGGRGIGNETFCVFNGQL